MKNLFSLFLLLGLAGVITITKAQSVTACEDYNTTTGEAIKAGTTWTIKSTGGNIYLLYKHGSSRNVPSQVVFYIDRKAGGSYSEEVATEYVNMNGKTFTVLDYKFMKTGDYKIGVHNLDGSMLAETYITVNPATGSSTTTTTTTTTKPTTTTTTSTGGVDTHYYADSEVIFCETVENNNPVRPGKSFTIPAGGGFLQIQVDNGKALKTTKLVVDVYRKPKGSTEYSEFVETQEYPIEAVWDRPYFKYTFTTAGDYVFDVYSAEDVYINSGYVTINTSGSSSSSSSSGSSSSTKGVDTYYYTNAKVIFCETVENNVPKNAGSSFTIPPSGASVQIQVDNGKALKTTKLIVKVYKKPKGGNDYSQFVETQEYPIEAVWDRPYFKYTFYSGGDYVFDVYNADNVYVSSGYVTINVK